MNFKLTFTPDDIYYREAYAELISLKKLKKFEPLFAVILFFFGIGLYYFDNNHVLWILPFFFIIMGIYEFFKIYYEKHKWLKERNGSRLIGQHNEFEFTDDTIHHRGPFSIGEMKWQSLKAIKKTNKGIVLKLESGVSMYLSDSFFAEKDEIDFILSRAKLLPE